jgi:hypothetical protein
MKGRIRMKTIKLGGRFPERVLRNKPLSEPAARIAREFASLAANEPVRLVSFRIAGMAQE